jgi:uncharacterized glyoxalase superfamily protein PhnB
MIKITPVLYVEEIEPCLRFWVDRLGFQKTVEVPEGDKLGFVILVKENTEVMLQTFASAEKDVPALASEFKRSTTLLFAEVSDLDDILPKLKGFEVVMPERMTFYGMREISVREPGGHIICFAAKTG